MTPAVTVEASATSALVGKSFVLYDDDDMNHDDASTGLHGDNDEDVPMPDVSELQDSDDPFLNRLAPAYIRPIYDLTPDDDVPFVLNLAEGTADGVRALFRFDNIAHQEDPDFWTIYMLGAYQRTIAGDADPDSQVVSSGDDISTEAEVDDISGQGAVFYWEMFKERLFIFHPPHCRASSVMAHEV